MDHILNIALKTAIQTAPQMFLDMYNRCLAEGIFPERWRRQILALLPKGSKPPDDPSSWRPLRMLDTVGKIFERVIQSRVEAAIGNSLEDDHYGFRKGRSTIDAINQVVNTSKVAIAGTRWKGRTKE
uniref:Uncharacterized protein n=1 Tax=Bracon brevicornis TaxID=1563983 RepID=A0A6V7LXF7_9HYME